MTSCLRIVPKFSTSISRAILFSSAMESACRVEMAMGGPLSSGAVRSGCGGGAGCFGWRGCLCGCGLGAGGSAAVTGGGSAGGAGGGLDCPMPGENSSMGGVIVAVVGSDSSGNMDSARGAADSGLAAFGLASLGIVKEN